MASTTAFFKHLFGFVETDYASTKQKLLSICTFERKGGKERCLFDLPGVNQCLSSGWHSTPSVEQLREEVVETVKRFDQRHPGLLTRLRNKQLNEKGSVPALSCRHMVGDATTLHQQCPNALFQVASQFNLLEFISSDVVPEDGVTHYVYDHTQGPACALACMPGTAYRNYLIHPSLFHDDDNGEEKSGTAKVAADQLGNAEPVRRGQSTSHQVNTLLDVERDLLLKELNQNDPPSPYFEIRNGYFTPLSGMRYLYQHLQTAADAKGGSCASRLIALCDAHITSRLRIGIVEEATVTTPLHSGSALGALVLHSVSQVYCSALSLPSPLGCNSCTEAEAESMTLLATSILNGAYEGTLLFGVLHTLNALEQQVRSETRTAETLQLPPVFLTKVGGGVFNNKPTWIKEAIKRALHSVSEFDVPVDVALVHFQRVDRAYVEPDDIVTFHAP